MKRIEKLILDGEYVGCMLDNTLAFKGVPIYSDSCEIAKWFLEEIHETYKLTNLEYEMIKFWKSEGCNWIVRDNTYNSLSFHIEKPSMEEEGGFWESGCSYFELKQFKQLFQFIKCSDVEPTKLEDILDNCEVED